MWRLRPPSSSVPQVFTALLQLYIKHFTTYPHLLITFLGGGEGHLSKDCTAEAKPKTCFKCNEVGHLSRDCPNATSNSAAFNSSSSGTECYRCGQTGHIARACPEAGNSRSGNFASFSNNNSKTWYVRFICSSRVVLNLIALSYTCGGQGHLSRDCVQGPKCYNCNGVVSLVLFYFGL
ncbi:hypothetical protein BDW22DRAFT_1031381 [Trametopsis cervina]|nr:hypothetical protein BDW22DRAFT_1031381 [Trametopsis cervina]